MPVEPMIHPLSVEEDIYAVTDETGKTIGTGTREVCEILLYMIVGMNQGRVAKVQVPRTTVRTNIRAAISI